MRIEAVGKIPELLETLLKRAEETTKKIKESTKQAYELAAAVSKVAEGDQPAEEKKDASSAKRASPGYKPHLRYPGADCRALNTIGTRGPQCVYSPQGPLGAEVVALLV